jgi:transposase
MERELYRQLYRIVYDLARGQRTKHVVFPDRLIVMTYFWAVLHDRPVVWACRQAHWPQHSMALPSASTMSRRLRTAAVLELIRRVEQTLNARMPRGSVCFIDAKPLPIGTGSSDPDAQWGYAAGRICKGYKLHAILDEKGVVRDWEIDAMKPREAAVAPRLIERLEGTGTLVGDNAYDSNALYELAGRRQWQLFAPRRKNTQLSVDSRQSPWRLRAHQQFTKEHRKALYVRRSAIERFFATLGNQCGGLNPLPNHLRRLPRVRLWVHAKLILYHLRLLKKAA